MRQPGAQTGVMPRGRAAAALALALLLVASVAPARAQQQGPSSFGLDLLRGAIADDPNKPKSPPQTAPQPQGQRAGQQPGQQPGQQTSPQTGQVTLVAMLTEDGQRAEKGVTWRIFGTRGPDGRPRVTATHNEAAPVLQLNAGEYLVSAAFGRANVTRRIMVMPGAQSLEAFMLNVGVLRVSAVLGNNQPVPANAVSFEVFSDERDQFGQRIRVVADSRPGRLVRLNSGFYQIVSKYGDANAIVQADLSVEPGKLTEAVVTHHAARVTLKLVRQAGGEAIADTQWSIINRQGDIVKETAGALPQHLLLPGTYTVSARSRGQVFRRTFAIKSGETAQIEVLTQ